MSQLGAIWSDNLVYFVPELVLTAAILLTALADVIFRKRRILAVRTLALAGLAGALLVSCLDLSTLLSSAGASDTTFFAGMVAFDPMAGFFRVLLIAVTLLAALVAFTSRETRDGAQGELLVLLLAVTLGMLLLAESVNLLMLYLALELVSIPSYVLVAWRRDDRPGSEAALKYILVGAVSTGTMLYGITLLYGLTGTYDIARIGAALSEGMSGPNRWALLFAGILTLAGFGFKVAAVPFHFWAPDVYTGAPTPVTAFLTIGPKAAGFAAMIRFFYLGLAGAGNELGQAAGIDWRALLMAVAVLTMTLGNLSAFFQNDLKRLLGYSSIAHAGFMLMGVLAMTQAGLKGVMIYLAIYLFMNLGAFAVVIFLYNQSGSVDIGHLRGIAKASPVVAGLMVILVLSLMGIPPLAGFWAKWYVFLAVIREGLLWLALVGAINTVFGYFYYARILKAMYLEQPIALTESEQEPAPIKFRLTPAQWALLGILVLPNILFVWPLWGPLDQLTESASHLLGIAF